MTVAGDRYDAERRCADDDIGVNNISRQLARRRGADKFVKGLPATGGAARGVEKSSLGGDRNQWATAVKSPRSPADASAS
jgi:hypothetical protein